MKTASRTALAKELWKTEGDVLDSCTEKDKILGAKIQAELPKYIHQIETFSFQTTSFRNPDLSLRDIGMALNLPISHIDFIFKYYCRDSFSNYKKMVRILDTCKLLEEGFLDTNKVEKLSEKVGFSSYNTFSIAFKNSTGVSVQEYLKRF